MCHTEKLPWVGGAERELFTRITGEIASVLPCNMQHTSTTQERHSKAFLWPSDAFTVKHISTRSSQSDRFRCVRSPLVLEGKRCGQFTLGAPLFLDRIRSKNHPRGCTIGLVTRVTRYTTLCVSPSGLLGSVVDLDIVDIVLRVRVRPRHSGPSAFHLAQLGRGSVLLAAEAAQRVFTITVPARVDMDRGSGSASAPNTKPMKMR